MVAVFTGLGAGFERGSAAALGGVGLLGNGVQGRGGDNVSVNAATGNLLINRRDEFMIGRGPDAGISRIYNSLGALDENGDHWRQSTDRRIRTLVGTVNTAGSTVKRVSADGSEIKYTYKTVNGVAAYWAEEGAGSHDKLTYASGTWTWTDGDSRQVEKYKAISGMTDARLVEVLDKDGQKLTYTYASGKLSKITTASGGYLKYTWSGNNITSVETYANGGTTKTLTRTRYAYDGSNRLIKVTTDLSPTNNSITDGKVYVTNYTYSGSTKRVATISQTDGSLLTMTYDGSGRVTSIKQTAATGEIRETKLTYASSYTRVYDPSGVQTILYHDAKEQLTRIRTITPGDSSSEQSMYFTYDSVGNVTKVTDAEGKFTSYVYDTRGNVTRVIDQNNISTYNTYDANNNLTRIQALSSQHNSSNAWHYTRYVYDGENHLRYAISPDGDVTEYRYQSTGENNYVITYPENGYAVGSAIPTLSQMDTWRNGLANRSSSHLVRNIYDAKGQLTRFLDYGATTTTGGATTAEGYTDIRYTYDSAGNLLSRQTINGNTESFVFDGLNRMISSTDSNGGTTTISFQDSTTKTVITSAGGHVTTNTYNKAGNLISSLKSGYYDQTGTSTYKYDKNGWLRMVTDATGGKTYYVYDKAGNKTAEVDHSGFVTEFRYDKNGRLIATARYTRYKATADRTAMLATLADPNNTLTVNDLKYSSNVVTNHHSYDVWQWTAYNSKGQVSRTIEGDGSVTAYSYDNGGRLVKTHSYFNKLSSTQLTNLRAGTAASSYLPSANASKDMVIRTFYSRGGRVIGTLSGEGHLSQIVYDKMGQKISESIYANPTSTSLRASGTFDQLNASITKSSTKDLTVRYVYDGQGQLRFTIDALGKVTSFIYGSGSASRGLVRQTIQHYATLPNLSNYKLSTVKAAVAALSSAGSNRNSWAVYNSKSQLVYTVDSTGAVTRFQYDTQGNVTKMTQYANVRSTTSLPAESTMNSWAGSNAANARITRSYYTAGGLLRFVIDPEGYVTRNDYDKEGRVYSRYSWSNKVAATDSWTISTVNGASKGTSVGTQYRYQANGQLSSTYDANGTRHLYTYYANGELAWDIRAYGSGRDESRVLNVNDAAGRHYRSLEYSVGTSGARTDNYTYYDGLGNVSRIRNTRSSHAYATAEQNTYFYYDKNGQVIQQTNAEGGKTYFTYDAFGNVATSKDAKGNITTNTYDRGNRQTKSVDALGYATDTTYTAFGEVRTVKRNNATTTFTYDKLGRLTRLTDALGGYENYTLDAFGNRITVRNKLGGLTHNTYDKRGQLIQERVIANVYNSAGSLVASDIINKNEYDSRGNLTKMIEAYGRAESRTTTYVYDAANRLIQKKGEHATVYTSSTSDAVPTSLQSIEYYTYDRRGNIIERKNSLGARTLFFYDRMDRLTHQITPTGTLTRNFYDANSNLMETRVYATKVTLPSNALGTPPAGTGTYRRSTFTYDKLNRMTNSYVHDVQTAKFGSSLVITSTTNDLRTQYFYDANGNVIKTIDPNGNSTFVYYDQLNRKKSQVDPERYRTDWTYDAQNNVTRERRFLNKTATPSTSGVPSVTSNSSLDRITDFTYDKNSRRLTEKRLNVLRHNGSGGHVNSHSTITYTYNALGQVKTKTEATGDKITYTYDAHGRMNYEQRTGYVGHTGATVTPKVQYLYNGLNDLSRVYQYGAAGVGARITKYNYDAAGRLLTKIDPGNNTTTFRYDIAGRILREEYSRITATQGTKTEAVGYTYDLENRVTQQGIVYKSGSTWTKGGSNNDTIYTQYNTFGDVSQRGVNNKFSEKFDYDNSGRLWRTTSGDGTYKYLMYDNNGNQTLAIASDGTNIDNKSMAQVLAYWGVSSSGGSANNIWTNYVDGVAATITKYDARNQAIEVREPERQIRASARYDLLTKRGYNAFGEVAYEIDANNARIDYTYNNMGRRIKLQSPTVSITTFTGSQVNVRPTEHYYYDQSGRLVAQRDANNNLTRQTLLKGTGYNGSQALVETVTGADAGVTRTSYDIFGNARKYTDQINRVTTNSFDALGRLTQVNHAGGLIDYYQYDSLGQKIKHYNNQYYSGNAEQIDYDQQGRIIRHRAIGGDVTSYSYAWSSSYATSGLGTFGGWNQNTTYANGKVLTERVDVFGRETYKNDLGGRTTYYTYDKGGRLTARTGSGTEDQNFSYLNTNKLYQAWGQTGTTASQNWTRLTATYEYDKVGNLKKESLVQTGQYTYEEYDDYGDYGYPIGPPVTVVVNTNSTLKNATATYDALGRLKTWSETGNSITPVAFRNFEYDANGNIRRSRSTFRTLDVNGNASGSNSVDDYWYKYDSMNRVVTAKGKLSGGQISRGTEGSDIFYNLAGERAYIYTSFEDTAWVEDGWEYGDYGFPEPVYIQVDFTNSRRENYTYDLAGRLTQTRVSEGSYNESNGTVTPPSSTGTLRGQFYYDKMGRQTRQIDYLSNGSTAAYDSTKIYNSKSQLTTDTSIVRRGSNTYKTRTTYSFGSGSSYALGAATYVYTTNYKKNSSYTVDYYSSTTNTYSWWDGAVQTLTQFRPNTSQSTINRTNYYYSSGGYLQRAGIVDGRSRTVTFTNDQNGQVIRRDERDNKYSTGDPHEIWYRFGGKEMGYVGNNGTSNTDYAKSITSRTATPGQGAFHNGSTYGSSYADFDQAYEAINSFNQGSRNGTYTVRSGDTLTGIAANLWGDAALWYKLAQANGLTGESQLIEGQNLIIPTGVAKSSNTASTFKPYDPGDIIGDLNPTTPEPPKAANKGKKCGVLGAILLVVIAVVVTIATAGAAAGAAGLVGGGISGGVSTAFAGGIGALGLSGATGIAIGAGAAAVGSIASQVVGVATGIQEKFSWKGVALAAISGGIGVSGISDISSSGNAVLDGAINGASASAISQGIGVVTGLQEKFSWAGVAAAGAAGAVSGAIGEWAGTKGHGIAKSLGFTGDTEMKIAGALGAAIVGAAAGIASAATRSAIDGSSFGDAIIASIPDVVGAAMKGFIGACFTGDTLVHTTKGMKRIDEVKVGDLVYSRDEHFNDDRVHTKRVIELYQFENRATLDVTISFKDGSETRLRTTPEHPFAILEEKILEHAELKSENELNGKDLVTETTFEWAAAADLTLGTRVVDIHGRTGLVTDLADVGMLSTVHNFAVEDYHTYFVGNTGVWVHNEYSAEYMAARIKSQLTAKKTVHTFSKTDRLYINEVTDDGARRLGGAELALLAIRDPETYAAVRGILDGQGLGASADRAETAFHNSFARAVSRATEGGEFTDPLFDSQLTYDATVGQSYDNGSFSSKRFAGIVAAMGQGKGDFAQNPDVARAMMGHLLLDGNMTAGQVLGVVDKLNSPTWLEIFHGVLDVAGFIPVIGIAADGIAAGSYLIQGKYGMAALSATAAVPIIGDAAAATRIGGKVLKAGTAIAKAAKYGVESAVLVAKNLMRRACFAAGTMVHTKSGLKPIEEIQEGDMVWSRSEHDTGEPSWRKVVEVACTGEKIIFEVSIALADGSKSEVYRTTELHPFWSETGGIDGEGGFVAAADLDVGEQLRLHDGSAAYVISVRKTDATEPVYNMSVDGFRTYHVGELGVWVHNDCYLNHIPVGTWKNADGTFNYLDPLTGKMVRGDVGTGFHGDHVFPKSKIMAAKGWDNLSEADQLAILRDPANLMPLPGSLNMSKGNRIEIPGAGKPWAAYKGNPVSQSYKSQILDMQLSYQQTLSKRYGLEFGY